MQEVYIYDAVRTPRGAGKRRGPLQEIKPIQLLTSTILTMLERHNAIAEHLGDLVVGCMTPVGEQGGNIARAAALFSGLPHRVAGVQVNRFCASGLEAVQLATAKIQVGWEELMLAGGLESMSRIEEGSDGGPLLFDPDVRAAVNFVPRWVSADLLATLEGYTREQLDEHALLMHTRALKAQREELLIKSIVPVFDINQLPILKKNECLRPNASTEWLATLEPNIADTEDRGYDVMATLRYPAISELQHLHTEGNSAPLADGAAMILLGNAAMGERLGLKARAKILSAATLGVEPTLMLHGATEVAEKAIKLAGLSIDDIDLWEINEHFAAVGLKFLESMKVNPEKVNVFGSDIAWGYAAGAMGAIALGTLLDGLEWADKKLGCIALCARGGMASALVVERV